MDYKEIDEEYFLVNDDGVKFSGEYHNHIYKNGQIFTGLTTGNFGKDAEHFVEHSFNEHEFDKILAIDSDILEVINEKFYYYEKGLLFTGKHSGLSFKDGKLCNGLIDEILYKDGKLVYDIIDDIAYIEGKPFDDGIYSSEYYCELMNPMYGTFCIKNGKFIKGHHEFEGCKYYFPEDIHSSNTYGYEIDGKFYYKNLLLNYGESYNNYCSVRKNNKICSVKYAIDGELIFYYLDGKYYLRDEPFTGYISSNSSLTYYKDGKESKAGIFKTIKDSFIKSTKVVFKKYGYITNIKE